MCQFDTTSLLTASKPLLTRYEEELRVLQSKSRMKDNVILKLNSDKVQLEQKVVDLEERLKKEAEKQVKAGKQCSKKIKNITVLLLFHIWSRLPDYLLKPSFPLLYNTEREVKARQIQITAEGEKIQEMEEMIKGLNSYKLQLEQEVAHLKKLLALKAENHIDKGRLQDNNCNQWQLLYFRLVGSLDA